MLVILKKNMLYKGFKNSYGNIWTPACGEKGREARAWNPNNYFTKKMITSFEPRTTLDNMWQTLIGKPVFYQTDVGHLQMNTGKEYIYTNMNAVNRAEYIWFNSCEEHFARNLYNQQKPCLHILLSMRTIFFISTTNKSDQQQYTQCHSTSEV